MGDKIYRSTAEYRDGTKRVRLHLTLREAQSAVQMRYWFRRPAVSRVEELSTTVALIRSGGSW